MIIPYNQQEYRDNLVRVNWRFPQAKRPNKGVKIQVNEPDFRQIQEGKAK